MSVAFLVAGVGAASASSMRRSTVTSNEAAELRSSMAPRLTDRSEHEEEP
jgi:hypothetical protein